MLKQILLNPRTFLSMFFIVQREDAYIEPQLKIELEDESKAPNLVLMIMILLLQNLLYIFSCLDEHKIKCRGATRLQSWSSNVG